MKLSDLIPNKCPYCGKKIPHYDIHLRVCKKYKVNENDNRFLCEM